MIKMHASLEDIYNLAFTVKSLAVDQLREATFQSYVHHTDCTIFSADLAACYTSLPYSKGRNAT